MASRSASPPTPPPSMWPATRCTSSRDRLRFDPFLLFAIKTKKLENIQSIRPLPAGTSLRDLHYRRPSAYRTARDCAFVPAPINFNSLILLFAKERKMMCKALIVIPRCTAVRPVPFERPHLMSFTSLGLSACPSDQMTTRANQVRVCVAREVKQCLGARPRNAHSLQETRWIKGKRAREEAERREW
jgi:hypothetical protein